MADKPTYEELERRVQELEKIESEYNSSKEALRNSEAPYRLLFEHANVGLFVAQDGCVKAPNPCLSKMLGYSRAELEEQPFSLFIHPQYLSLVNMRHQERLSGKTNLPQTYEFQVISKNGTIIWVQLNTVLIQLKARPATLNFLHDITERKRAEEALQKSLTRYNELAANVPVGVYVFWFRANWHLEFEYVSDRWCEIHQLKREDVLSDVARVNNQVHPDERDDFLLRNQESFRNRIPFAWEGRFLIGDEKFRWLRIESTPIVFENGDIRWFGVTSDITDRKQAEEELRQSGIRLRQVMDLVPHFIFAKDVHGTFLLANKAVADAYGNSPENLIGKSDYDFAQNTEEVDFFVECDKKVIESGTGLYNIEESITDAKGSRRYLETTKIPFTTYNTTTPAMLGVSVDITERKRAEKALEESEERFRTLMDNIDAVAVQGYGPDGTTQYWNAASEKLYGYSQQEAIGRNLLDLIIPPEMRGAVAKEMREMAESGQPISSGEMLLMHKDGSRVPVLSHHVIVKVPGREQELFCLDVDITERKRAEKEKEKLQSQLNQAQKMESVGRLAGGVAHDFNNMLSIINGYAEITIDMLDPGEPARENIREIYNAGNRSTDIVRQLLAFARQQTISPAKLDLNDTISGMLKMLQRLIGENIELTWHPGNNLWPVKIDPSQVDQIMANLAVNARDAISDVGKLTIETKNVVCGEEYRKAYAYFIPGQYIMLAVSDDGCGMETEIQNNLFEPFFTTKETGKGTGLGLSTIYGIVKQNNGFINVYSEPGIGTTFKIYLPRYETNEVYDMPTNTTTEYMPTGSETILLVEDEPAILEMGREMIERLGYTVLTAKNPNDALRVALEYDGTIELLITDVVMPEMNGRDLSSQLVKNHPGLKTLYMSGYTADVIAHHGVLDEGVQFIQKPFSLRDLAKKVREVIEQG